MGQPAAGHRDERSASAGGQHHRHRRQHSPDAAAAHREPAEIGKGAGPLRPDADRGADPAAVYGRYRRPSVPRIRRHPCRRYSYLSGGLPDSDADDVRPYVKPRIAAQAEPFLPGQRAFLRTGDRRLWPLAEPGAEPSMADARRRAEHPGAVDYPVGLYPERLLPDPG